MELFRVEIKKPFQRVAYVMTDAKYKRLGMFMIRDFLKNTDIKYTSDWIDPLTKITLIDTNLIPAQVFFKEVLKEYYKEKATTVKYHVICPDGTVIDGAIVTTALDKDPKITDAEKIVFEYFNASTGWCMDRNAGFEYYATISGEVEGAVKFKYEGDKQEYEEQLLYRIEYDNCANDMYIFAKDAKVVYDIIEKHPYKDTVLRNFRLYRSHSVDFGVKVHTVQELKLVVNKSINDKKLRSVLGEFNNLKNILSKTTELFMELDKSDESTKRPTTVREYINAAIASGAPEETCLYIYEQDIYEQDIEFGSEELIGIASRISNVLYPSHCLNKYVDKKIIRVEDMHDNKNNPYIKIVV